MVLNLDRAERQSYGAAQYDGVKHGHERVTDHDWLRNSVMSEPHALDPLRDLGARLKALRAEVGPTAAERVDEPPRSGLGFAFAVASHLVAGLVVGTGIGYLLDRWLDTSPWMLVVFFFMGSAAGMLNVYRMASGMGMALGYRPAEQPGATTKGNGKDGKERGQSS